MGFDNKKDQTIKLPTNNYIASLQNFLRLKMRVILINLRSLIIELGTRLF